MARYRKRYRKARRMQKKGFMHDVSLYFKSPARRKGALVGMALVPLVTLVSSQGRDAFKWLESQYQKVLG